MRSDTAWDLIGRLFMSTVIAVSVFLVFKEVRSQSMVLEDLLEANTSAISLTTKLANLNREMFEVAFSLRGQAESMMVENEELKKVADQESFKAYWCERRIDNFKVVKVQNLAVGGGSAGPEND